MCTVCVTWTIYNSDGQIQIMIESFTGDDLIWVQKIWFRNMWIDLDLIPFYAIWFGDLNKSQLSVIWAKE